MGMMMIMPLVMHSLGKCMWQSWLRAAMQSMACSNRLSRSSASPWKRAATYHNSSEAAPSTDSEEG